MVEQAHIRVLKVCMRNDTEYKLIFLVEFVEGASIAYDIFPQ